MVLKAPKEYKEQPEHKEYKAQLAHKALKE